jgi:hypothetical protein
MSDAMITPQVFVIYKSLITILVVMMMMTVMPEFENYINDH